MAKTFPLRACLWLLGAALLCACSGGGKDDNKLRVGNEPDDGHGGGSAGFRGSGSGQVGDGGIASGNEALSVPVRDEDGMTIEVVTLACAGACAEVEAIARGGNAPYTFAWEDGTTNAKRRVCLDASKTLSVSATDTAIDSEEFQYAAMTTSTVVTAQVLGCTDGGVPGGELCLENPSIEGTAGVAFLTPFDAPPWNPCTEVVANYTSIGDETISLPNLTLLPPSDGETYGVVSQDSGFGGRGILAQTLCAPIEPGSSVSFLVDLARSPKSGSVDAEQAVLEIRGGAKACSEDQSLWLSAPLTFEWETHCVTLQPAARVDTLSFTLYGDGGELFTGLANVMIDHIVPVESCP